MIANTSSTSSQGYTVYVNNIPEELNEAGIRDIFAYYGNISSLFYRPGTNWAYVGYKSYLEAETAMKNLNNVPPLGLKLSLAKEKLRNDIKVPRNGSAIKDAEVHQSKSIFENCDITVKNNSLTPCLALSTQSIYNKDVSDASANALWARGETTITANGKRHVSLGRGYTLYEIPNPHPQVETQIRRVCEKRYPGLYQFGEDVLDRQVGTCARCANIAKHKCERCHEFYCGQECQIADWPRHKSECIPVPALVAVTDTPPMKPLKTEEKVPTRRSSAVLMPLRPPKQLLQNQTSTKVDCEPANNTEQKEMGVEKLVPPLMDLNMQGPVPVQQEDVSVKSKKSNHDISIENADRIDETIAFQRPEFLPKTKYTKVKIVEVESPGEYWVQKPASELQLAYMVLNLQTEVQDLPKVLPKLGNLYAAKFEDCWYRCIVISLRPLKVHFVDYGNSMTVTDGDIRDCKSFKDIPYFCGRIKLLPNVCDKYKNMKVDDELSVKAVSVDNQMVITVEIEGEAEKESPIVEEPAPSLDKKATVSSSLKSEPQTAKPEESISSLIQKAYSQLPKLISSLKAGDAAMIMYNEDESYSDGKTYSAHLALLSSKAQEFNEAMRRMAEECELTGQSPVNLKGVLICGRDKKGWFRGYALSTSVPCKMACIDYGKIIDVQKVVVCPEKYKELPVAGISCSEMPGQLLYFNVLSVTQKGNSTNLEVEFSGKKATLTAWNIPLPAPTAGIQFATLKNNSKVHIVAYRNQSLMYLSSLEPDDVERNNATHQAVARCVQTAAPVKEPVIGQVVIAPFKDGNCYRVIIREISPQKIFVSYIDYGNSDYVCPTKLKELPHNLQKLPSCVAKVFLKDVPRDVPMSEAVDDYIAALAANEEVLTYTGDSACAVLKDSNGHSINDKINNFLIPNWKKEGVQDKTCYMLPDLKVMKLGPKGETVTACVLQPLQYDQIMLCPYKMDIISYIHNTLPTMIRQYCEANEHYIPRDEELCLVLYQNEWCRGVCVCRDTTAGCCNIFIVDTGIMDDIEYKNIRAMTKDFMAPDALACMATVINLAPKTDNEYSPEVQKRLSELIVKNQPIKVKIIEEAEDGSLTLELPEIRQRLLQENLIKAGSFDA